MSLITEPPRADKKAYFALALLFLIGVTNYMDRTALGVLQIPIKAEFGLSDSQLGALTGLAFFLPYVIMSWPIARIADRSNRIYLLAGVLGIWSLATGLIGWAQSFVWLVVLRMGVAVGESACLPVSYSLIADYFPPKRRARAIAFFALAFPLGTMMGLAGGGALASAIGWRASFISVGVFGLLLIPVALLTMREPKRGAWDRVTNDPQPPVKTLIVTLWKTRAFRYLALAAGCQAYVINVLVAWGTPFYVRVHGYSLADAALIMGFLGGIAGAIGSFTGGMLVDKLAKQNYRWNLWIPALSCFVAVPLGLVQFLVPSAQFSLVIGLLSGTVANIFLAPSYAITQSLVSPSARAFTTATLVSITAIVGGAFAPFITGVLSDYFTVTSGLGGDGLRYAICISFVFGLGAAGFYFKAATYLPAKVPEQS